MLKTAFAEQLQEKGAKHLYRERRLSQPCGEGKTIVDGRKCINFSSNDYLGLSLESRLKRAYQSGIEKYGFGSGGSSLISGFHPAHQALEAAFAEFLGRERALFFPSGYSANLGLLSTFLSPQSEALIDKLSHASVYDGLRLSGAKIKRYRHCDMDHAKRQCEKMEQGQGWFISESVFSMSGQLADIQGIVRLAGEKELTLVIDDAHGVGVLGDRGQGCLALFDGISSAVDLLISPLGKAFASTGAIISGDESWIDALINFSRSYIYSTAVSPAQCHGLLATLRLVEAQAWRRELLQNRIGYFRRRVATLPLTISSSYSAIQLLTLGDSELALNLSDYLMERGIFCVAVRPPTVAPSQAGLRVTINATHSERDIDYLYDCLSEYCEHVY